MTNLDNWQEELQKLWQKSTPLKHFVDDEGRQNFIQDVPFNTTECNLEDINKFITSLLQAQKERMRDEISNEFRAAHLTLDKAFDQGVEWGRKLQREENNELKWTLTPQKDETK